MATERPLLLNPNEWSVRWQEGETREDVLGNHVLWILARVINLIYGEESNTAAGKRCREAFLQELEEWRAGLSETFIGIPFGEEDELGFKRVFFTVTAAGMSRISFPSGIQMLIRMLQLPVLSGTMLSISYSIPSQRCRTSCTDHSSRIKLCVSPASPSQNFRTL